MYCRECGEKFNIKTGKCSKCSKKMTDVDKVNYYAEAIYKIKKIDRIRITIFIVLYFLLLRLIGNSNKVNIIYTIIFIMFLLLLISYFVFWIISYYFERKYRREFLELAENNQYILCSKCKKYKIVNKKCESCGDDSKLTDDERIELLNGINLSRKRRISRTLLAIFLMILGVVIFLPHKPVNIENIFISSTFINLTYKEYILILVIFIILISATLIINLLYSLKTYNKLIKTYSNNDIEMCTNCNKFIKKNDKKHKCN